MELNVKLGPQRPGHQSEKGDRIRSAVLIFRDKKPAEQGNPLLIWKLEKRALDDTVDLVLSCFNPLNVETDFLWLLFSIKSKSKILKYTSVKAVFRGEFDTRLEPGCLEDYLLILRNPQTCRNMSEWIWEPQFRRQWVAC